jgi:hypothetical protein
MVSPVPKHLTTADDHAAPPAAQFYAMACREKARGDRYQEALQRISAQATISGAQWVVETAREALNAK